jgi:hypothetical protein
VKPYLQVESTRTAYHADPARNSVHRSSLLAPAMDGAATEISFLNHFLIKRGYRHVACRVTGIDSAGKRIESRLYPVEEPRVYTLPLSDAFGEDARLFLIEFFAAENLFIPFPAVMVNHRGDGFANTVHSYNRVLNDVFEDDEINRGPNPPESSIDVDRGDGVEGFFLFTSGMRPVRDSLSLEYAAGNASESAELVVDMPRFTSRLFEYRDAGGLAAGVGDGEMKVHQPLQPMFYSRLFTGRRSADGAFTANHSYYDNSAVPEYWDNTSPGFRSYPYFPGIGSRVRMHPIMSPGELLIEIALHDRTGREAARVEAGRLTSPGGRYLETDIDAMIDAAGIAPDSIACCAVHARPLSGNVPTRINHQLLYGDRDALFSSINVSLKNANTFMPKDKTGLTWGQVMAGGESEPFLGIVGDDPAGPAGEVEVTLYDHSGEIGRRAVHMPSGGAVILDLADIAGALPAPAESGTGSAYWFVARSARPDLTAIGLSRHAACRQVTGEHGF